MRTEAEGLVKWAFSFLRQICTLHLVGPFVGSAPGFQIRLATWTFDKDYRCCLVFGLPMQTVWQSVSESTAIIKNICDYRLYLDLLPY
jgi:hypothetical protein